MKKQIKNLEPKAIKNTIKIKGGAATGDSVGSETFVLVDENNVRVL